MSKMFRSWTPLMLAALLLGGLSACSKSELVEPADARAGVRSLTGDQGLSDPSGGISDDGDDEGDNERSQRKVTSN